MITIEKAALAEIGAIREYMKRDANGNAVMNEMGQPVMGGHYRQVVFQGPGMKADLIIDYGFTNKHIRHSFLFMVGT
mgnify:CR=1 FL=1